MPKGQPCSWPTLKRDMRHTAIGSSSEELTPFGCIIRRTALDCRCSPTSTMLAANDEFQRGKDTTRRWVLTLSNYSCYRCLMQATHGFCLFPSCLHQSCRHCCADCFSMVSALDPDPNFLQQSSVCGLVGGHDFTPGAKMNRSKHPITRCDSWSRGQSSTHQYREKPYSALTMLYNNDFIARKFELCRKVSFSCFVGAASVSLLH